MKKFRIKMYLGTIFFFIITFLIFGGAYVALSQNFINTKTGENFVYMAEKVGVEFNVIVKRDYDRINSVLTEFNERTLDSDLCEEIKTKVTDLNIPNVTNLKVGYVDSNHAFYLDGNSYEFDTKSHDFFFEDNVTIQKLPVFYTTYSDKTTSVFYRYENLYVFFDANPYLDYSFKNVDGMPEATYMVVEKDGNILSKEDTANNNIKFYLQYTKDYDFKYKYDDVADDLYEGVPGFGIFSIEGVKSYFIYAPILGEVLDSPLYIGYSIDFALSMNTVSYLRVTLLIVFSSIFILFNVIFVLTSLSYAKKEQDIALSRINHYFIKPFSLLINKKGEIVSTNKSFNVNIDNHTQYKTIYDIDVLDGQSNIQDFIKNQQPFTAVMKSVSKDTRYVRFIPVKSGLRYCLLGEDATDQMDENTRNKKIALFNPVTSLPNRNVLNKELKDLVDSKLYINSFYSLIAIDIVDFGKVNRIFGFAAADKMLKEISNVIKETLIGLDAEVFNIRTSLFMVFIKKTSNFNEVISWSKKCLDKLQEPINIKNDYLTSVDTKMGIYNIEPSKTENISEFKIYECATTALDRAKNSRLTKCAVYNSEFGRMLTRDQIMEEDLQNAINNDEFVMYYQAQYNTKQKRVVGFEALLRWDNPKYRFESVEHFVSIAEKNGMIVDIGHMIIEKTFKFAKSIEGQNVHISMNVSPVQLLQSGFVNELIERFEAYQLKPGSIAIEITETFLMENSDQMISKLKLLREKGFDIHLDDFGIGYSSLLYLKDLPVDLIKIDKEFVKHMLNDKFSRIIVTKIVQIALNLDLDIIAEGVETEKQRDLLSKMGCNIIQGYLISKAVSEVDSLALLAKNKSGVKLESDVVGIDEFSDNVPNFDETSDDEENSSKQTNNTKDKSKKKKKTE